MSQKSIVQLVTSSFDYNRLGYFLHGTSVEAAAILLRTGTLPTANPIYSVRDYLYFIFNRPKYDSCPFSYDENSGLANIIYAEYPVHEWWTMEINRALRAASPRLFLTAHKEVLENVRAYSQQKASQTSDKKDRQGVVISIHDSAVHQLSLEQDPEDEGEEYTWSRAYLPHGLSMQYVDKIIVFRDQEFHELIVMS